jgi:hypothetical protein
MLVYVHAQVAGSTASNAEKCGSSLTNKPITKDKPLMNLFHVLAESHAAVYASAVQADPAR